MSDTELRSQIVNRGIELVSAGRTFDAITDDKLGIADAACSSPIRPIIASVDRTADVQALSSWMLEKLTGPLVRLG